MFEKNRDTGRPEPELKWPDAICVQQPLTEGYLAAMYGVTERVQIPAIVASVSRDKIFPIFLEILDVFKQEGSNVDVSLDTITAENIIAHSQTRNDMSLNLILSHLEDTAFQDALLSNGEVSLAIMNPERRFECQLDHHKQIIIYTASREAMFPFEVVLRKHGIQPDQQKSDIPSEINHMHLNNSSSEVLNRLIASLGLEKDTLEDI